LVAQHRESGEVRTGEPRATGCPPQHCWCASGRSPGSRVYAVNRLPVQLLHSGWRTEVVRRDSPQRTYRCGGSAGIA
jgi:hypothetical protein